MPHGTATPLTVGVIFALSAERASLRHAERLARGARVGLYQSGPGAVSAAEAARQAVQSGAAALVSFGLAGGLSAEIESSDVVVPRNVISSRGQALPTDPDWHARLVACLEARFVIRSGDLLSVDDALETAAAKARAARESGAVAVDMESSAIVEVACRARVPVAVLRVVADEAADALPENVDRLIDESGRVRALSVLRILLAPSQWSALLTLSRRSTRALAALRRLGEHLAANGFCRDNFDPSRNGNLN